MPTGISKAEGRASLPDRRSEIRGLKRSRRIFRSLEEDGVEMGCCCESQRTGFAKNRCMNMWKA